MIETGDYEVSDLYKNCLVKHGVWNLLANAQKERRFEKFLKWWPEKKKRKQETVESLYEMEN